jgi:hypothetical protein
MQLLPLPGITLIVQPAVSHVTASCDTKHFLQLQCAYLLVNSTLLKKKKSANAAISTEVFRHNEA